MAEPKKEPALHTAAQLCKKLRESFTGDSKLQIIRNMLAERPDASAEEAFAALVADPTVPQKTLDKARAFIDLGAYTASDGSTASTPLEDVIAARHEAARASVATAGKMPEPPPANDGKQNDPPPPPPNGKGPGITPVDGHGAGGKMPGVKTVK